MIADFKDGFRLSPCGESGLKLVPVFVVIVYERLSPCGESGLKSLILYIVISPTVSLPMRGEWIEIDWFPAPLAHDAVSPHAGRVD